MVYLRLIFLFDLLFGVNTVELPICGRFLVEFERCSKVVPVGSSVGPSHRSYTPVSDNLFVLHKRGPMGRDLSRRKVRRRIRQRKGRVTVTFV